MMGGQMTNGQLQQGVSPNVANIMSENTPVAYMQPIAITPASIRWVVGGMIGAIWSMYAAGWLFLPAKQDDMTALTRVVQTLQVKQDETNTAVKRLTEAVDNLSGIVSTIKQVGKIKNAAGSLKLR